MDWAFKVDLASVGRLSETPKELVEAGGDALVRAAAFRTRRPGFEFRTFIEATKID